MYVGLDPSGGYRRGAARGWRGLRFNMSSLDIKKRQLRARTRAHAHLTFALSLSLQNKYYLPSEVRIASCQPPSWVKTHRGAQPVRVHVTQASAYHATPLPPSLPLAGSILTSQQRIKMLLKRPNFPPWLFVGDAAHGFAQPKERSPLRGNFTQ